MAKRENHYEQAFEHFLRQRKLPYIAVDETRRSLLGDGSLKSLDFIVSPGAGPSWLVDVKGRQFPSGRRRQYWKNWCTVDDLRSLSRWERVFGTGFRALLLFAYQVVGRASPLPPEGLIVYRGRLYAFLAMRLDHYAGWARQISPKWETIAVPATRFRDLAEPADQLFARPQAADALGQAPDSADPADPPVASGIAADAPAVAIR